MSENPAVYLTNKMWKYAQGNRRNVVLYFSLFTIGNLIWALQPLVIAKILNIIQEQGLGARSFPSLFSFLAVLVLVDLGFWVFHGPARIIENRNAFLVRANYKNHLLQGVMAFPLAWHTDHHSGDTIDKIEKGTGALYDFSGETFTLIEAVVRLMSSYVALVYFNLHSSYLVLFMVFATIFFITRFDRRLVRQYEALYGKENKISERIFDVIGNITTVIILRIEQLVASSIYKKIMEPFGLYMRNRKVNEVKWFLTSLSGTFMVAAVIGSYLLSTFFKGEVVLVGTVYALYGYLERIRDLFFNFAWRYGEIVRQKAAVMNAELIVNDFQDTKQDTREKPGALWRELRIEDLLFSYHTTEGADLHLDNVSMSVQRGQRVALIGESGSGKTTFLKIMRELYQPNQANVYIDGKLIEEGFQLLSPGIALIPQDPEIFSTTIRENITVGVEHDDAFIKRFTDMARFTDVVRRLPHKLDSFIYEKGVNLSGGEKQRLALARGLMACEDKSIILLDEPTSSVDTKNELRIFENIFREFKDKTILASVHRLHLLPLFHKIYFFHEGKILASGTLAELLQTSSEFTSLWKRYHSATRKRTQLTGG